MCWDHVVTIFLVVCMKKLRALSLLLLLILIVKSAAKVMECEQVKKMCMSLVGVCAYFGLQSILVRESYWLNSNLD